MVEQIEGLGPKGELDAFGKPEILDEREVEVDAAGPEQSIPAETAVGVKRGCSESRIRHRGSRGLEAGIEPALECSLIGRKRSVAQTVRPATRSICRGSL